MVRLEQQHRAVKQLLIARQRNRHFHPAPRGRAKAMPGNINDRHYQKIDGAQMLQFVNSLGKRRIKAAPEHLLDPQH